LAAALCSGFFLPYLTGLSASCLGISPRCSRRLRHAVKAFASGGKILQAPEHVNCPDRVRQQQFGVAISGAGLVFHCLYLRAKNSSALISSSGLPLIKLENTVHAIAF
jgi:hypothetical protein